MNIASFLERHRLPAAFADIAADWYAPLANWVERLLLARSSPGFVLGINGSQGSGKSTLSNFLTEFLASEHGRRVVELSIDDLYLTRMEREALAADVHPLLATRGVPGTHDLGLGRRVLRLLADAGPDDAVGVPRFDKSVDDRRPEPDWPRVQGPVDLIVFEGWCVASEAQRNGDLAEPVNELERTEDPDGTWRRFVNAALRDDYPSLFRALDALVFLAVPDFESVYRWRLEQEHKLRARATGATRIMTDAEVARFVQHFERITLNNLRSLPARADVVMRLDREHRVTAAHYADNDRPSADQIW